MENSLSEQQASDLARMSQFQPTSLLKHQAPVGDQMKEQALQFRCEAASDLVLESVPMSPKLINSLNPSGLERNLGSKSFQQSPDISMQMLNSHRKRELSPSSFIWRRSVRSQKLPEIKGRGELNPDSEQILPMLEKSHVSLKEGNVKNPTTMNLWRK